MLLAPPLIGVFLLAVLAFGPPIDAGKTVLLKPRTKLSGCTLAANPDRRCSPGAYYSKLTKAVICSSTFRPSQVRNVAQSEKFAVEREYGMEARSYHSSLEIDHIISLELGGSNDIANLCPETLFAHPGYRIQDKLENKLHNLVCAGRISLPSVPSRIASDWQKLYEQIFKVAPRWVARNRHSDLFHWSLSGGAGGAHRGRAAGAAT